MLIFICLYIVGHFVIGSIYLYAPSIPSIFISVTITGEVGTGIQLVSEIVSDIIAGFLGRFSLDLVDFLYFAALDGLFGNAVQSFVLIIESL